MKKKKSKNSAEKTFHSGEVMTLLENMSDKIELVAEQHGDVIKRISGLDRKITGLEDKVDKMDVRLSGVEDRINMDGMRIMTIESELKMMKRDNKDSFKSILEYLSRVEEEVQSMKKYVSKKADKEKIADFEKRLIKTEKLVLAKIA